MKKVVLKEILVLKNQIEYRCFISEELQSYFCVDSTCQLEYSLDGEALDLSTTPQALLAVPFVCNVLPIIWLTDAELVLPELDEDFYRSIPEFKKGYVEMYPDAVFAGKISVGEIVSCVPNNTGRSAAFFSGGLDAWCTLARHIEEKPDLVLLWGSDIPCDDDAGWRILHQTVAKSAEDLSLPLITIKTSFRKVINEGALSAKFAPVLHDGWWHGVQHGIALIGHAAPLTWTRGISKQYIAASYSPEDGKVLCASYPTIDNYVRFAGCSVFHDAFITRTQKTKEVIAFRRKTSKNVSLHVCWETTDGENCCNCEKCFRTIMGIALEGGNPEEFGFRRDRISYSRIKNFIYHEIELDGFEHVRAFWKDLQQSGRNNQQMLLSKPFYDEIKWIETFDFDHPERYRKNKKPVALRLRRWLSDFQFYQKLSKMKRTFLQTHSGKE